MITLDAGQLAALAGVVKGAVLLVDMHFQSGIQYKTTHTSPITYAGNTYGALGQVMSVSQFSESGSVRTDRLKVRMTITDSAVLAFLIGPSSEYRNRKIKFYVQLLGQNWEPVQLPIPRWSGYMDKLSVTRTSNKDGEGSGYIEMSCVRAGLARFRNADGLRMTHAQQQIEYPGDMGLEYTESLVKSPVVWLSKDFQREE